jgi:DNA-binding beta-propeller fold protein YncE
MKNVCRFSAPLLLLLAVVAAAQTRAPKFQQVNKFVLGGEGGWDYLTYDPAANRLFVAHNDQILIVDAASGKKTGEIAAQGSHGIALVPELNRGFFTNGRAGTVTAFDLKTLKPVAEIKVGENPDATIYDSFSKRVVVMNGRSKDLMAIDPQQMKVVATVPLGGKLEEGAADPNHIYVNVEDTGELAVVDSKTWKQTQRWKLAGCEEPSGLAIDLKTEHLFSVCGNEKMIVVNASNGNILATLPTGAGTDGAAFDPTLKLAFASNGQGTLTVVRQAGSNNYEAAENVTTQRGARTIALDTKSNRVFLPTAEFGTPEPGQRRPPVKPGTFSILVFAPARQ